MKVALIALIVLAGCATSSPQAAPPATAPPTYTVPALTWPVGVAPYCADSVTAALDYVTGTLGGNVSNAQYGDTPFEHLLATSLDACSSQSEWLTMADAHVPNSQQGLENIHRKGCAVAGFVADAVGDPLPSGCT